MRGAKTAVTETRKPGCSRLRDCSVADWDRPASAFFRDDAAQNWCRIAVSLRSTMGLASAIECEAVAWSWRDGTVDPEVFRIQAHKIAETVGAFDLVFEEQ